MDLPVRHVLLRDGRDWLGDRSGLALAEDGSLSLVALPAPARGAAIVRDGPFTFVPSGIVALGDDEIFIADARGKRLIFDQRECRRRFVMNIDATPGGTAIGGDTLYVTDSSGGRVLCFSRKLELRRIITRGLQEPTAIAIDRLDRLIVLDRAQKRLLRLGLDGTVDATFQPQFDQPEWFALDANDTAYVSDSGANAVYAVGANGARLDTLNLPTRTPAAEPRAVAVHGDLVLVADEATGALMAFDRANRTFVGEVPDFRAPVSAMAFDKDGNLLIKPTNDDQYLRFVAGAGCVGSGSIVAGPFDAGELNDWERVAVTIRAPADGAELSTFVAATESTNPIVWTQSPSTDSLIARAPGPAAVRASSRFLWLKVVLNGDARTTPVLEQVKAQTLGESYIDELPRIFRRDDQQHRFLERWLALFRSGLEDREQALEDASRDFDPIMAEPGRLAFTADALAFALPRGLTPAQQRALLRRVPELYERRGTLAGVADMCEVMSGVRPRILEAFHARRVWQLGTTSLLGFDTALAAAAPEGLVVPHDARTDPAYAGLRGDYYAGTDFNELLMSRTDPNLAFDALEVRDRADRRVQPYTVRWSGQIKPRFSETHLLRLEAGAGARLWIDGQPVIDRWSPNSSVRPDPRIVLDASRWHAIQIEMLSLQETSVARLSWSSRHQRDEVVPAHCLYSVLDEHADLTKSSSAFDVGNAVVGESAPLAGSEFGSGLFADYAHLFTVIAPAGSCRDAARRVELREAIEAEKPAHTDYHLCFVEPRMRVGFQARLGIDAIVAKGPPPLRLDGTRLDHDSYLDDAEPGGARVGARGRLGQDAIVG